MKIVKTEVLLNTGALYSTKEFEKLLSDIDIAISKVVWPQGSEDFTINPTPKGNGVKPIKLGCMDYLEKSGWNLEKRMKITNEMRPGPLDAVKQLSNGSYFSLEWETGNISSSHRALNKICLGIVTGALSGGILILPSRRMYNYLTDRIGNFQEISPYFQVWKNLNIKNGFLSIIEIEHDNEDLASPLIPKGTDGRAKI